MTTKKFKAIPFILGFLIILLLAGFMLGLRTVIEFDPASAQVKTTKYLFLHIPISSDTHPTWISPGRPNAPNWTLLHEFHHSAAGSKLTHTHWGAAVDTLQAWEEYRFDIDAKDTLSTRTRSLINSDFTPKAIRIYLLRIDRQLKLQFKDPSAPLTPELIDTLIKACFVKPIDAEANMIPDP